MRKTILLAGAFTLGVVLGVAVTGALVSFTYPMHRRLIRIELAAEEEFRVYRARRHGHQLEAIVHAWNAARLAEEDGFRTFAPEYGNADDRGPLTPLRLIILDHIRGTPPGNKTARNGEVMPRAILARALEVAGFSHEAEEQWAAVASLVGSSDGAARLRAMAESFENMSQSKVQIAAETAVLGPDPADSTGGPSAP